MASIHSCFECFKGLLNFLYCGFYWCSYFWFCRILKGCNDPIIYSLMVDPNKKGCVGLVPEKRTIKFTWTYLCSQYLIILKCAQIWYRSTVVKYILEKRYKGCWWGGWGLLHMGGWGHSSIYDSWLFISITRHLYFSQVQHYAIGNDGLHGGDNSY